MDKTAIINFTQKLKVATTAPHEALEDLPLSKLLVSPQITKEQYTHYLALMHDVVKDAEENIYPLLSNVIEDIDSRKKAYLIENDLNCLGYQKEIIKRPLDNEVNYSTGFALGVMYVIEGSTLGGRVILKNINKSLGFNEDKCASYFNGYGLNTGPYWKKFLESLSDYESEYGQSEEIINGAYYAFDAIKKHFILNSN